jgi:hypothetical protein
LRPVLEVLLQYQPTPTAKIAVVQAKACRKCDIGRKFARDEIESPNPLHEGDTFFHSLILSKGQAYRETFLWMKNSPRQISPRQARAAGINSVLEPVEGMLLCGNYGFHGREPNTVGSLLRIRVNKPQTMVCLHGIRRGIHRYLFNSFILSAFIHNSIKQFPRDPLPVIFLSHKQQADVIFSPHGDHACQLTIHFTPPDAHHTVFHHFCNCYLINRLSEFFHAIWLIIRSFEFIKHSPNQINRGRDLF